MFCCRRDCREVLLGVRFKKDLRLRGRGRIHLPMMQLPGPWCVLSAVVIHSLIIGGRQLILADSLYFLVGYVERGIEVYTIGIF